MKDEEEDLFIIDQSAHDFLVVKRAEYMGYQRRLQSENDFLFTPSFLTGTHPNKSTPVILYSQNYNTTRPVVSEQVSTLPQPHL